MQKHQLTNAFLGSFPRNLHFTLEEHFVEQDTKTVEPDAETVKAHLREVKAKQPDYDPKALVALGEEIGIYPRGFTLLELLIVIVILSVIVTVIIQLLKLIF